MSALLKKGNSDDPRKGRRQREDSPVRTDGHSTPPSTADGDIPIITVHHEAVPGQGEDAEPFSTEGPDGALVMGVFDGLGGAGGARYDIDGVERKGAYIASRLARAATEAEASEALRPVAQSRRGPKRGAGAGEPSEEFADQLESRLCRDFETTARSLGGEPSKLRSSMVRILPTTAAIATLGLPRQGDSGRPARRVSAIWAGDSRIYALSPTRGLAQISRDDIRADADAFTSLSTDPPIDNCISASEPFVLRRAAWDLDVPGLVIVATDGCFGYLPTPAHFERMLLEALTSSASLTECQQRLNERIASVARDDATMVIAILDCGKFADLQMALLERRSYLDAAFVSPYEWQHRQVVAAEAALAEETARRDAQIEARDRCAAELWDQYRSGYERFLAPAPLAERSSR
jgi:serine/threonine protein phosphatase PrpC